MFEMFNKGIKYVFGGYINDENVRFNSTSGGAFSAIVDAYCDEEYVLFGAEAEGLEVFHSYITDKRKVDKFRKSKYSQSRMGKCYKECSSFLNEGKKVLFSGTPCQIAGLKTFLNVTKTDTSKLLTVEVVCEGVPSPLYIRKYEEALSKKYGRKIKSIDYRYTGKLTKSSKSESSRNAHMFLGGRWDFEMMKTELMDDKKKIVIDRWFNPFWTIWIDHLMSRPSCYECQFAKEERTADITLGDLWGVHLYCPELYGNNGGASLIFANTDKGKRVVQKAQEDMCGHELKFEDAIRYQGPMRRHIMLNSKRNEFMEDLKSDMSYEKINKKWAKKPTLKLLWQKYIWGNRQKIAFWNLTKGKFKIK